MKTPAGIPARSASSASASADSGVASAGLTITGQPTATAGATSAAGPTVSARSLVTYLGLGEAPSQGLSQALKLLLGAPRPTGEEGDAATPDGPFALMAVPKRKVTPSRRKRRNQFKRIDFVTDVQRCRDCGKVKMPHVYCDRCSANVYEEEDLDGGGVPRAGVTQP